MYINIDEHPACSITLLPQLNARGNHAFSFSMPHAAIKLMPLYRVFHHRESVFHVATAAYRLLSFGEVGDIEKKKRGKKQKGKEKHAQRHIPDCTVPVCTVVFSSACTPPIN
jgi:hypothetical protein